MRLKELIQDLCPEKILVQGEVTQNPEIGSIHYNSKTMAPKGGLFVALQGVNADGHDFIEDAVSRGAEAVVAEKPVSCTKTVVVVNNARKALSGISARLYGFPSAKLNLTGITGTNGKTTITYLLESILAQLPPEEKTCVGVMGTITRRYPGKTVDSPLTTPESPEIQAWLHEMVCKGVTHCLMEVSSHALHLFRADHLDFDLGIFTNLSQDHLDYHKDMETYYQTKKRFFTEIMGKGDKPGKAVINVSDPWGLRLYQELQEETRLKLTACAHEKSPVQGMHCITGSLISASLSGMDGRLGLLSGETGFRSHLTGLHNLENIRMAAAAADICKVPEQEIQKGIEALSSVPGRLERVVSHDSPMVFVDYAHTPAGLENVLCALRAVTEKRIIVVFGCGGDRDRKKRPLMGEAAARLADFSVITSDNPRTEEKEAIIRDILAGVKKTSLKQIGFSDIKKGFCSSGFIVEPDRKKAIFEAVFAAYPDDAVLIAGKGHETYQIIGTEKFPFDDMAQAKDALNMILEKDNAVL